MRRLISFSPFRVPPQMAPPILEPPNCSTGVALPHLSSALFDLFTGQLIRVAVLLDVPVQFGHSQIAHNPSTVHLDAARRSEVYLCPPQILRNHKKRINSLPSHSKHHWREKIIISE